jgi:muramoyltetrapeptide carboxypeptidase
MGWEPVIGAHALTRVGYFAGSDAERASDLNVALHDPDIDGVWFLRGGYGAMRILPAVDYHALRAKPRALIGFSDITALHAAVAERAGLISYHGPTARGTLSAFSRDSLARAVTQRENPCGSWSGVRAPRSGRVQGRLAGGNLALLAALCGTPWFPDLDATILVLEDVNEAVYRVDRMLRQLLLAGVLRGVRAIAFGHCSDCPEESDDGARTLDAVVTEIADELHVPCVLGIPVGHIDEQWTLPLGAIAELDAGAGSLTVIM